MEGKGERSSQAHHRRDGEEGQVGKNSLLLPACAAACPAEQTHVVQDQPPIHRAPVVPEGMRQPRQVVSVEHQDEGSPIGNRECRGRWPSAGFIHPECFGLLTDDYTLILAKPFATRLPNWPPGVAKMLRLAIRLPGLPTVGWQPLRPVLNTERAFAAVFRLSLSEFGRNL